MTNLPANPGEALWIGSDSGKYHCNVGIGGPGGDLDHTDYSQSQIEDGFSLTNYFYLDANGDVVFKQFVENGRTSENTKYSRTELRELQPNGTTTSAWDSSSGTFSDEAISKIDHAPAAKPWVVFFQVHNADSDFFRVQLEDGSIVCRRTPPGAGEIRTVLRAGYTFGTWLAWKWQFDSGRLRIWLDGTVVLDVDGMTSTGCYAKLGCYNQVNNRSDGGNAPTGEYCQVTVQRGSLKRVRPGYPASSTPIWTGTTDPNGGPGRTGGVDTQPPTAPLGLTVTRTSTGNQLTWQPSTDNVGVDHYNVYRSGGTGSGGGGSGGGTTGVPGTFGNVFGKTDSGSSTTTSSADKIISSKFLPSQGGTLAGGHARMWLSATGSTKARMLVYEDDTENLLATSDEITVTSTTEGVVDFVFSGSNQIAIKASTPYWLTLAWQDPGSPSIVYSRGSDAGMREERSDITYPAFPNPFGASTFVGAGPIDVWADLNTTTSTSGGTSTTPMGKLTDGSGLSASSADKTAISKWTAPISGTLDTGHARAWMTAGSTTTKVVVYADSSGVPGALLASSDALTLSATSEGLRDYTFSGGNRIAITNGTAYWVGLSWQDPGTDSLNLSRDSTTGGRQEAQAYTPNPFGTPTPQTGPVDVYVDIVTAGGSGGSVGGGALAGYTRIAQPTATSYLDTAVTTTSGQTRGVGGIPAPAAGPNVVLVTADSSSRLKITTSGMTYDGQGHSVAGITITADNCTVQNFVIHNAGHDGVNITGSGNTVQNCDYYDIYDDGTGDINGNTVFGDNNKIIFNTAGVTGLMARDPVGGSHTDWVQTWNTSSKRSTSGLIVQNNHVVGPATSDDRFIHQFVQGEGKNSTDGGGGGSGVSSGWLIADNLIEVSSVNQIVNFLDIHNVDIARNTFIGSSSKIVGTGDGSSGITFWSSNVTSGFTGTVPSTTSGSGPAGVGTSGGVPISYSYLVTAVDAAGNESGAGGVGMGGGAPDVTPPTVPTNLVATPNAQLIGLHWGASTDDVGVTQYAVYRDGTVIARVGATSYVDRDVVSGTTYSYTVSASDAAGNESAQSAATSVTAIAPPVGGVALLPGRIAGGKVEVSIAWGADLSADETTWTWTDVTGDVRQGPGISTSLGRNDESATSNPAALTIELDNSTHVYSLGTISAHYPYVRRNTPVRVRIDPGDGKGGRVVFLGYADGWSPSWDSLSGKIPVVKLSASGALRRLGQGSAPVTSAYRRVMTARPSVVAYWPLEEGKSSDFAPAVRGGSEFDFTGGAPDWAANTDFDCSAPLPTLGKAYWNADVNSYTDTGASQVRFLLSIPSNGLSDGTVLAHFSMTGTIHRWDLTYEIDSAGVPCLGMFRYNASDGSLHSSDIIAFPQIPGQPGRLSLDWTQSGSNIVWTLGFTPAVPAATGTFFRATLAGRTAGIVSHIEINPHNADISAAIGHLTVENTVTSYFDVADALIAHIGDYATPIPDGRIARLCAENNVPYTPYGDGSTLSDIDQMGPQLVAPLLDLLHEAETADQGQLWDGRTAGLAYTTRRRRGLSTPRFTVNASLGRLAADFTVVDDDQRNRNRVTVTRLHGTTVTYEDTSGPLGTAAIGRYEDSVTVNTRYDKYVADYAIWFVTLGTVVGYRYPTVTIDLAAAPAFAPLVLDIIAGERIDITSLDTTLAGFPDSTVSLTVEGIAHEITSRSWKATFRCSPYAPWAVGLGGTSGGSSGYGVGGYGASGYGV